jgi:hypothetical protein
MGTTHPSHSQTFRLITSSLSSGVPVPREPIVCQTCRSLTVLVTTTADSSATGVELTTDDCRQPAGITDENSFFIFLMAGDHFFEKKWGLTQKMALSTQKMELDSMYCSSALSSSSTSSRTRLSWVRTVFSTVGCDNLFLRLMCIHPEMFHIWSYEKNHLQKHLFDKDLITTLYHTSRSRHT